MPVTTAPSEEFLRLIPHEYARRHLILSAGSAADGCEALVASEQTSGLALYNAGVRLRRPVKPTIAPGEEIASAIDRAYAAHASAVVHESDPDTVMVEASSDVEHDLGEAVREAERDLLNTQGKSQAVRLVDLILFEALRRDASDVHVQPLRDRTLVRYRLDGALHTARELPGSLASAVVSRIKVMSRLDVAERRTPQDGHASVSIGTPRTGAASSPLAGRRVDLRVSTLPSTYGERVVIRLLDPSRSPHLKSFGALGMPPDVEKKYLQQASRTSGIVLSTGPTGSGKTTTLYTTLAWISASNGGQRLVNSKNTPQSLASFPVLTRSLDPSLPRSLSASPACELNIMSIEDPVEYDLSGGMALSGDGGNGGDGGAGLAISQTQVDPKKNVTFATGLRHILRQDPDVIMVGEIRDEETARIAVQASLTGHLVLSTLHTGDSASAVARLLDLGVEPFLVASSLSAALAQRLVRTIHNACRGAGCDECYGSGLKGRTGIFELLVMDDAIRDLVGERASAGRIKDAALRGGMNMLSAAGAALVERGVTTRQEVARVIHMTEEAAL